MRENFNNSYEDTEDDTIYYNFLGNFPPSEWRHLKRQDGKRLSKTSRQLLALIVFYTDFMGDPEVSELQQSYFFFEDRLEVCQPRVRQCLLELATGGYISFHLVDIIKNNTRCRNTLSIKLLKKFQRSQKKIQPDCKKVSGQP